MSDVATFLVVSQPPSSYDASVRLFDMRNPTLPIVSTEVGGGVWRVKWHPTSSRKDDLLVACMHDGFKILHYNDAEGAANSNNATSTITNRFNDHESLAYGVDWSFAEAGKDDKTLIGSCSFYDHLLHVWRS
jgi:diphthine methyl ester acylhydrolase